MLIRRMQEGDLERVACLCGELGFKQPARLVAERFVMLAERQEHAFLVAETAPGLPVAGFVHVTIEHSLTSSPRALITSLVVGAEHRRRGVGAALVAAAEDWARACGLDWIRVRSRTTREHTPAFYTRQGYLPEKIQNVFHKPLPTPALSSLSADTPSQTNETVPDTVPAAG